MDVVVVWVCVVYCWWWVGCVDLVCCCVGGGQLGIVVGWCVVLLVSEGIVIGS